MAGRETDSGFGSPMKILLVVPPVDHQVPDSYRGESLGLGYIAAVLRRDGHDVEILDAYLRCIDVPTTISQALSRDFDCIGLTSANASKKGFLAIVKAVRQARRDVLIIAGGYLTSLNTPQVFEACPELDFVVRGEGESVTSDVMGRIERGEEWREAPGIAYLRDGKLVMNPVPPLIEDLDSLPFPARDALRHAAVSAPARILASRGCYHNCSFCSVKAFYGISGSRTPRSRDPEKVVDEIESVIAETGITDFTFSDDDLIGPGEKMRERVVRLADEIQRRGLKITFSAEFRADETDPEMLGILKNAGLTEVFIGVESGVQSQLDRFNKRVTVEQNKKAIEVARASGIAFRCGFIMFDPYTTVDEVQANMRFIEETGLDSEAKSEFFPLLTKLAVYRGTPMEQKLREDGLLVDRGLDLDYQIKNPQLRIMMQVSRVSGLFSGLVKSARKMLSR